jgi:hypothetical protein
VRKAGGDQIWRWTWQESAGLAKAVQGCLGWLEGRSLDEPQVSEDEDYVGKS